MTYSYGAQRSKELEQRVRVAEQAALDALRALRREKAARATEQAQHQAGLARAHRDGVEAGANAMTRRNR